MVRNTVNALICQQQKKWKIFSLNFQLLINLQRINPLEDSSLLSTGPRVKIAKIICSLKETAKSQQKLHHQRPHSSTYVAAESTRIGPVTIKDVAEMMTRRRGVKEVKAHVVVVEEKKVGEEARRRLEALLATGQGSPAATKSV